MLWNKARPSDNVKDTRKHTTKRFTTGKTLGVTLGAAALAGVFALARPTPPLEIDDSIDPLPPGTITALNEDTELAFVRAVLGDTEDTWTQVFRSLERQYPEPVLTLFEQGVASACGYASSAIGPFYCSENQQLYLDLGFFRQMSQRFSVEGDLARAYVIAHEIGHHVQIQLGLSLPFEDALKAGRPTAGDDGLEVRSELQADCLAGVWAHHAQQRLNWLEPGDLEGALQAAAVFGDDYRRGNQTARVMPETFTHGTSAQRARWFQAGFDEGRLEQCDTFSATQL